MNNFSQKSLKMVNYHESKRYSLWYIYYAYRPPKKQCFLSQNFKIRLNASGIVWNDSRLFLERNVLSRNICHVSIKVWILKKILRILSVYVCGGDFQTARFHLICKTSF